MSAFKQVQEICGNTQPSLAIVDIAAKPYIDQAEKDPVWITEIYQQLADIGFQTHRISYQDKGWLNTLKSNLLSYDCLYLSGGNSFVLNCYLQTTQLSEIVIEFAKTKQKAIIGASAGAIVLTSDIQPYDILDKSNDAPEVITKSLKLIPHALLVHWENPKFQARLTEVEAYYQQSGSKIYYIKDADAIYFDGADMVEFSRT